ncbi:MAG: hypothetical protein ACW9W3_03440 [Candidatus Nitrosopumilus sp. bin_68KS]
MNNVKILNKPSLLGFKQIEDRKFVGMGITSPSEYVDFFINLNMGENVSLLSFINNEKNVLKKNLDLKNISKEPIKKGIEILELLVKEINENGEKAVLEKYQQ